MQTWQRDNFLISTDQKKLNYEMIHQFLCTSYWAQDRSVDKVIKSIKNSLSFGLYENDKQIGFARVITDYSTFAYLCDVFVLPSRRKLGLGKWLIDVILSAPNLQNVVTWMLLTTDAQKLYEQVGFMTFPYPERAMVKKIEFNSQCS